MITIFSEIYKEEGEGTIHYTMEYEFLDQWALIGTSYYQLKQTDFDGTITSSKIIMVAKRVQDFSLKSVFLDMAHHHVNLCFNSNEDKDVTIRIYGISGRLYYDQTHPINVGINTIEIPTISFHSGIYLLKIADDSNEFHSKFTKY